MVWLLLNWKYSLQLQLWASAWEFTSLSWFKNIYYSMEECKIISHDNHTSLTMRYCSLCRQIKWIKNSYVIFVTKSPYQKTRGKCGVKDKRSPRTEKILIRNNKIISTKTCSDLQRVVLATCFYIRHSSTRYVSGCWLEDQRKYNVSMLCLKFVWKPELGLGNFMAF